MLIDFLSRDGYNEFNISLAHAIGLEAAVYLNELFNIYSKATRKQKIKSFNVSLEEVVPAHDFFQVDREYITQRTTISEKDQFKIDEALVNMGIIIKSRASTNELCIVQEQVMSLFLPENAKVFKKLAVTSTPKKLTKAEQNAEYAKAKVKLALNTEDVELNNHWGNWIESIFANPKVAYKMNDTSAKEFKQRLEFFANGNREAYIELIKIATELGYSVSDWVITKYKDRHKELATLTQLPRITSVSSNNTIAKPTVNLDEFF